MKKIHETFMDEEFERLKKIKGNMTWHDFILTLVENSDPKVLARQIKEQITNGWSNHERSHFNEFLKEEIKPYWPVLYAFLVENLGEEAKK